MRKVLIACNWKMNHTVSEAEVFFKNLKVAEREAELLICPPYTDIPLARHMLENSFIKWGAQNIYPGEKGAFTGEISGNMLKDLGCSYVICGHSERRMLLKETDEFVGQKVRAAFEAEMTPILCIGETSEEREKGEMEKRLFEEIKTGLAEVKPKDMRKTVIAYEPIWAIGTGKAATAEDAESVAFFIRSRLKELVGKEPSEEIRILYGGSVNSDNISLFIKQKNVDGVLIGGAGLQAENLGSIYKQV